MSDSDSPGFPLFQKAHRQGILDSGNGLIVAPTATGKSFIGRWILVRAAKRHEPGVHVYLVPYRALASEMYRSFRHELSEAGVDARLKVSTGDHTEPIYPEQTDILIATYERLGALLSRLHLKIGRVVADEVHLIADKTRGVVVEGLLARMKHHKHPTSLLALSAVVSNPENIGAWLDVPILVGESSDRAVHVKFDCKFVEDLDSGLNDEVESVLESGDQTIIFCQSKRTAQRVARELKPAASKYLTEENRGALGLIAGQMAEDEDEAQELLELLSDGIAYHHAGLSREGRKAVEASFLECHLKAIACTPTLAAGVNLPAGLVIVRDVFRTEFIRGYPHKVMLSTGELLNMLGRAGRPGQVDHGRGVAIARSGDLEDEDRHQLQRALSEGRGDPIRSHLPDSFDALMRFLLAVSADRGEVTLADLADAVRETLWYHERPEEIDFQRPFLEDIMEDIPSYKRVTDDMRLERVRPVPDGVTGEVLSNPHLYSFSLRLSGEDCTCPAKSNYHRRDVCKHVALAIHRLLFEPGVDPETRSRAIYACGHLFRKTLDLGTKIREAVRVLVSWKLLESVPGAYRATAVGTLAASSRLDLLLIRTAHDRIRDYHDVPTPKDVAFWVIDDFFPDEKKRSRWKEAMEPWLEEVDVKQIKLPERYRGDFDRGREDLGQLAMLYGEIAASLGKPKVAEVCRLSRGCIQYGVAPDLIPLAALRIRQLGRARCRFLFEERGIRGLEALAKADPEELVGRNCPLSLTREWVERARSMWEGRRMLVAAEEPDRPQEVDEFLATFQVDHLTLDGDKELLHGQKSVAGEAEETTAAPSEVVEDAEPEASREEETAPPEEIPLPELGSRGGKHVLLIASSLEACTTTMRFLVGERMQILSLTDERMCRLCYGTLDRGENAALRIVGIHTDREFSPLLSYLAQDAVGAVLLIDPGLPPESWGYLRYLTRVLKESMGMPCLMAATHAREANPAWVDRVQSELTSDDAVRLYVGEISDHAASRALVQEILTLAEARRV